MENFALSTSFEKLTELELIVLSCIALNTQSSRTKVVEFLNRTSYKRASITRQFNLNDIKPIFSDLLANKFISEINNSLLFYISKECKTRLFQQLVKKKLLPFFKTIETLDRRQYYNYSISLDSQIILSILSGNISNLNDYYQKDQSIFLQICEDLFDKPFNENFIAILHQTIQEIIVNVFIQNTIKVSGNIAPYYRYMEKNKFQFFDEIKYLQPIIRADTNVLIASEEVNWKAIGHLFGGDNETALSLFEQENNLYRNKIQKKNTYLIDSTTYFWLLALLKKGDAVSISTFEAIVKVAWSKNKQEDSYFRIFEALKLFKQNQLAEAKQLINRIGLMKITNWNHKLAYLLAIHWFDCFSKTELETLQITMRKTFENEYWILSINIYEILLAYNQQIDADFAKQIEDVKKRNNFIGFANFIEKEEKWEQALNSWMMFKSKKNEKENSSDKRLVWFVDFKDNIQPKEQSIDKKGEWTEGRNIALKRLIDNDLDYMTTQDTAIATSIKISSNYYGQKNYYFDLIKTYQHMVGHPLLFSSSSPPIHIELQRWEPELNVKKIGKSYELSFNHAIKEIGYTIEKESDTRYKYIEITEELLRIKMSFDNNVLIVPEGGKDKLEKAVQALSKHLTIHSDMKANSSLPSIQANSTPHIQIQAFGAGFRLEFFVKPFTSAAPYFKAATGGKVIFSVLEGKRYQAIRDHELEEKLVLEFINECPSLTGLEDYKSIWDLKDAKSCLEFLADLENVNCKVVVEWPEGEKLRVKHVLAFKNLKLNIKGTSNDWFSLKGEVRVNDELVMQMGELLGLLKDHPGNFIPLGKGDFISLNKEFRRRLDEMNAFTHESKGEYKLNSIAAFGLNDLLDDFDVKADKQWRDSILKVKESIKQKPQIPSGLEAELRPYQIDGYEWLYRLSHWGVGACLADDMGLGKTIQAIALLLERSQIGPALVLAPASVCNNWIKEVLRFAPSLNPIFYADQRDILQNLSPLNVLVCTYGMLQANIELFTAVSWHTLILDEAHAIKNNATKRTQAVMELKANFKLITTGTPIQNHLGELWTLFNFINPGLLSSLKSFTERFAVPIEKNQDVDKRNQLRRLIQPFILRRTKNQVLQDLPEKTEITINIVLSEAEMAFYEALRREALQNIERVEGGIEQRRFQILAEITKLRRACCNPSLVSPFVGIESSKLAAFEEIVDELLENKHKALVFSQFIGHLDIIKVLLQKKGLKFQYLDGSTPLKEREKSITDFQAGKGDLFLISLKAGGVGLNLTAADYVIHLDPWWNPAIEDQASDRAHRIGQKRPVTIYKLITQFTIEEKIISLHHNKRDLADSLLEGSDMSAKITADDLLNLIKN